MPKLVRLSLALTLLTPLASCQAPTTAVPDEGGGSAVRQDCVEYTAELIDPAEGGFKVHGRDALSIQLSGEHGTPSRVEAFVDGGGTDGWQRYDVAEDGVVSVSVLELVGDLEHAVQVRCDATSTTHTMRFATLPPTVTDLQGSTYLVDLLADDVKVRSPSLTPVEINYIFNDDPYLLLHVERTGDELHLSYTQGNIKDEGDIRQEECMSAPRLPVIDFETNPAFDTEEFRLEQEVWFEPKEDSVTVPRWDSRFRGVFVDGGDAIRGLSLRSTMDVRYYGGADLCDSFGPCHLCPDQSSDDTPLCIAFDVYAKRAPRQPIAVDPGRGPLEACN